MQVCREPHRHTHTSSAASDASIRYDVQNAEAYQACLASELQQHFIPLIQQELNVDVLCDRLKACLNSAAQNTMPQACVRDCVHSRKHQPYQVTAFGSPAALLYYCRLYDLE